jgi:hypothetical protein
VQQICAVMDHLLTRALRNNLIILMKLKEGNIQFYLCNRNKLPHFKVTAAVKLHDVIFQGFDT